MMPEETPEHSWWTFVKLFDDNIGIWQRSNENAF